MHKSIFVEWWPEHDVDDPAQKAANAAWAAQMYDLLRDGGILGTDHGAYIKRDGGLYRFTGGGIKPPGSREPTKST